MRLLIAFSLLLFRKLLVTMTREAPSKRSFRLSPTTRKLGNRIQHVFTVQLPDIPWHLHSWRISDWTCCNEKREIFSFNSIDFSFFESFIEAALFLRESEHWTLMIIPIMITITNKILQWVQLKSHNSNWIKQLQEIVVDLNTSNISFCFSFFSSFEQRDLFHYSFFIRFFSVLCFKKHSRRFRVFSDRDVLDFCYNYCQLSYLLWFNCWWLSMGALSGLTATLIQQGYSRCLVR